MIKGAGSIDGEPLLMIGLSRANTARLLAGLPITFRTEPLGLPAMTVLLIGGEDEDTMREKIAKAYRGAKEVDLR